MISRFDLIFLLLDKQDVEFDRRLCQHLVGLYIGGNAEEEAHDHYGPELLKRYIQLAREVIPVLSPAAQTELGHFYQRQREESRES